MRKLFVVAVIAVFIAYCYGAFRSVAVFALPAYQEVKIDLLAGKTARDWENDPTFRRARLMELAAMRFQPPVAGLTLSTGKSFAPGQTLNGDDLEAIVQDYIGNGAVKTVTLRDPSAVYAFAQHGYLVRDELSLDGEPIDAGTPVTKELIDRFLSAGKTHLRIVGNGETIAPQPGTIAMVILIFLGLVAMLQEILWQPMLRVLDERKREVESGSELVRTNKQEVKRLAEERVRLHGENRRAYMNRLLATQREAQGEADKILKTAKAEARLMREKSSKELDDLVQSARTELEKQIPDLARQMADQVLRPSGQMDKA